MNAKHTPGPLTTEFDPMHDGDHATLVVIPSRSGLADTWVASCFHNWNESERGERRISWKEAEANALLFAAAPDMLDALRLAEGWIEENRDAEDTGDGQQAMAILEAIRAAIDKAEGRV